MYARTALFDATINRGHKIATKVEVWRGGSSPLKLYDKLQIIDGNVTVDDQLIRRRTNIALTDPDGSLTPNDISDLLAPNGNELKLYRGIQYDSINSELLPLGVFGISQTTVEDSGDGLHIGIDAYDRARKVSRAKLSSDYLIAAGTNYQTAIQALLSAAFPSILYNFPTAGIVTDVTPRLYLKQGEDPWKQARQMAASIGYDLYFDVQGVCTMVLIPTTTTLTPAWTYAEGSQAMILDANKRMQDENVFNHIIVTGEHSGLATPICGEAKDVNPASPTYIYGPYGDVPRFVNSQLVTTGAQANAMAAAELTKTLGLPQIITFQSLVNPAHEVWDVAQVTRAKSKINNLFIFQKFSIPMVHSRAMAVSTRERVI